MENNDARGWYVDTSSGWVTEPGSGPDRGTPFQWGLPFNHSLRQSLTQLSECGGNVSMGVSWHLHKVEVFYGHGLLGHDGLCSSAG